jgi:transcriptional regulator with GAF, ATPase, and Fis domain
MDKKEMLLTVIEKDSLSRSSERKSTQSDAHEKINLMMATPILVVGENYFGSITSKSITPKKMEDTVSCFLCGK